MIAERVTGRSLEDLTRERIFESLGMKDSWLVVPEAERARADGVIDFLAPDVGYYTSDVTRMWPVDGRFNLWQRDLYGFYLASCRRRRSAPPQRGRWAW